MSGPQGAFNLIDRPCTKALMLSGGSGITPLMSMTRWQYDIAAEVDVHFVHSARTPEDIIFHQELRSIDARSPNFRLSLVCEGSLTGISWAGYRGFLNADMLVQMVPDLYERTAYVCGPEAYMQAIRTLLGVLNFPRLSAIGAWRRADCQTAGSVATRLVFLSRRGRGRPISSVAAPV